MKYNPELHHRRSIRLQRYDYASAGAYFVTICTQNREVLFGTIDSGGMTVSEAGAMIDGWWAELANKFPAVRPLDRIVMPNHLHGIIWIDHRGAHTGAPLPEIVQWFKTMTTNEYIRRVNTDGWPSFPGRLWQRNYYERVIRDEAELNRIRQYIADNPAKWAQDPENPRVGADLRVRP